MQYRILLSCLLLILLATRVSARPFSFQVQAMETASAIRLLAQQIGLNVVLSSEIKGDVTISLRGATGVMVLDDLLAAQGLMRWRIGSSWYIAPRSVWLRRIQEEKKWQDAQEATVSLQTMIRRVHYAEAEEIAHLLADEKMPILSKRGHVRIDKRTNTIFIHDTPEQIRLMDKFIRAVDVPVRQILIKARLVSIDSDYEKELGVRVALASSTQENECAHITVAKLTESTTLDVKLRALERDGHAKLISSPSLFTANQQTASIEAGEEIPYQEVSEGGGTGVMFKKAVLALKVMPQILPDNHILLKMQIKQDRPSHQLVQGVPTISTRAIVTNALARDRQTVVIGGIYENDRESGEQRIPFFAELPILGFLFKESRSHVSKRELLIFVTPMIVSDESLMTDVI